MAKLAVAEPAIAMVAGAVVLRARQPLKSTNAVLSNWPRPIVVAAVAPTGRVPANAPAVPAQRS